MTTSAIKFYPGQTVKSVHGWLATVLKFEDNEVHLYQTREQYELNGRYQMPDEAFGPEAAEPYRDLAAYTEA